MSTPDAVTPAAATPPAIELFVLRHGRTAWNVAGRFQGHTDVPLDDAGEVQARALGAQLAAERIDCAVSSDLVRAAATARAVIAGRALHLAVDARWREMAFGAWEGLTWAEIVAADPSLDVASATRPAAYRPPGGETFEQLRTRIAAALESVQHGLPYGGRALISTHAGPLHALLSLSSDHVEPVRFLPGSISRFVLLPNELRIASLNASPAVAKTTAAQSTPER